MKIERARSTTGLAYTTSCPTAQNVRSDRSADDVKREKKNLGICRVHALGRRGQKLYVEYYFVNIPENPLIVVVHVNCFFFFRLGYNVIIKVAMGFVFFA